MNVEQSGFVIKHGDFRMQDWLLKADLSAGAKLTYSVLACCAGGRDYVWPSQEYLAEKVSVSVRTLQRYLKELIQFGLIEKCKQYIKGQVRNIYRFLLHSVIDLGEKRKPQNVVESELPKQLKEPNIVNSDRHDTLSPRSEPILQQPAAKLEKPMPPDTTNFPDRHDKTSSSLNKEENIKGKEYNPPTPLAAMPASKGGMGRDDSGKEGELNFTAKKEDSDWIEAKARLGRELTKGNFQTWIAPLIFEREKTGVVLRCPNAFFMNWVKSHFAKPLVSDCKNYEHYF